VKAYAIHVETIETIETLHNGALRIYKLRDIRETADSNNFILLT